MFTACFLNCVSVCQTNVEHLTEKMKKDIQRGLVLRYITQLICRVIAAQSLAPNDVIETFCLDFCESGNMSAIFIYDQVRTKSGGLTVNAIKKILNLKWFLQKQSKRTNWAAYLGNVYNVT